MKILVCVKYVPDFGNLALQDLPLTPDEDWDGGNNVGRMSRYDEYAVEAALQLKALSGTTRIDAVTVGPRWVDAVLRRALGMGVDHAVHIQQAYRSFPSPFAIGALIAAYARGNAYDLILCGAMSEDLMQGQVGPVVAGRLDLPCLTAVHTLRYSTGTGMLRCEREVGGGRHEVLALDPPAVVSIQSGLDPPRYPPLSKMLRANQYPLEIIAAASWEEIDARQSVVAIQTPAKAREGYKLDGSAREKAQALAEILRSRGRL